MGEGDDTPVQGCGFFARRLLHSRKAPDDRPWLRLANDRPLLRRHANSALYNVIAWLTVLVVAVLTLLLILPI
jgi:hypothetical protein